MVIKCFITLVPEASRQVQEPKPVIKFKKMECNLQQILRINNRTYFYVYMHISF
jgi:hypothetical protein